VGVTPGLKLPYPELTEIADGPDALNDLATAVEGYTYNRVLPAGVTRMPGYYWGERNTAPLYTEGARIGDTYWDLGVYCLRRARYGTSPTAIIWEQAGESVVANETVRRALSTNQATRDRLSTSHVVRVEDSGFTWRWQSNQWELIHVSYGPNSVKPMLGLVRLAFPIIPQVGARITGWEVRQAAQGDVLTVDSNAGVITCNANGRVAAWVNANSDATSPGWSNVVLKAPGFSGTTFMGTVDQFTQRPTSNYGASGTLRQTLTLPPVRVREGDQLWLDINQATYAGGNVNYDCFLNVEYI
jgi:hypothetical protein